MTQSANPKFQPGTLVNCRRRLWRVDYQDDNILHVTSVNESTNQTRIYLPLEKVTTGSLSYPSPDRIGRPQDQKLMLDAFRLSMVNSTTPLRSLQFSRAIPMAYQLVPVVMALEQERVRMLIADDVGLGKTIEAGLIMQELRHRGLAKRLLVICPASLREQWREALAYFFHIDAYIYSRENRRQLEKDLPAGANLLEFHDAFIVSVDYAKATEVKNLLLDTDWDIVAIDEAHQVAKPHQVSADHTISKDRWDLAVEISHSERIPHLLLLTATPHNGYTDAFASLIRLLDVGAVTGASHDPDIHTEIARQHIVQRRRVDVEAWLRDGPAYRPFPTRDQAEKIVRLSAEEMEAIKAVANYGNLILENARVARKFIQTLAGWTVLHLHKRALSSPEALRCSLANRKDALLKRMSDLLEEDPGLSASDARANVLDEQVSEIYDEDEIIRRSEKVSPGSKEMLQAELDILDDLIAKAKRVSPARDSKLYELTKNVLPDMLRVKTKVIIFTKYIDTKNYVAEQLAANPRFSGVDVFALDGTLNEIQRREVFSAFADSPKAVLVATDAISEGINLQYLASQVIHYELPWNPNRLEQRNGRVDRFGQPEPEVKIRTMVLDETLDATILKVLVQKSNQIRQDYGFSPPYFGDETSVLDLIREHNLEVPIGDTQLELFRSFEHLDTSHENPFSEEMIERIQRDSFYGQTDISLELVDQQIQATYRTIGTPEAIQSFVISGLNRYNCQVTPKTDGTLKIAFQHPELKLPGLPDVIPSATFNPERGLEDPGTDVLDLGHPLVRRMIDLIKLETFDQAEDSYGRSAGMLTRDVKETTAVLTLLVRFVTDTEPIQIFEDLVTLAIPAYGDQPLPAEDTDRLAKPDPAPGALTEAELGEVLGDVLQREDLADLIETRIQERQAEITRARAAFRQGLQRDLTWLDQTEHISLGSWDILAVNILWPA
ncbi:MAG: DEAD/DEAH box helicase [Brevefilum sp.]|nr:DEAD/DEAH box helicase [Brevefilum sp.]